MRDLLDEGFVVVSSNLYLESGVFKRVIE